MAVLKMALAALAGTLLFPLSQAQKAQCASFSQWCNKGTAYDGAVKSVIAKFRDGEFYGGKDAVTFASALSGADLAEVSYSCTDDSVPPPLSAPDIRTLLELIHACPNQCGSLPSAPGGKCGLSLMTVADAQSETCFAKAINVQPQGRTPSNKTFGSFKPIGCFSGADGAALSEGSIDEPDMTIERCLQHAQGFKFVGLSDGESCYWSNTISTKSTAVDAAKCNKLCPGETAELEVCGGLSQISIYEDQGSSTPNTVSTVGDFGHLGCFADPKHGGVLTTCAAPKADMTLEKCAALAFSFHFVGVENGRLCCWGDAQASSTADDNSACEATPCSGDRGEACGAKDSIIVYEDGQWSSPTIAGLADFVLAYDQIVVDLWSALEHLEPLLQKAGKDTMAKRQQNDITTYAGTITDLGPDAIRELGILFKMISVVNRTQTLTSLLGGIDGPGEVTRIGDTVTGAFKDLLNNMDQIRSGTLKGLEAVRHGIATIGYPQLNTTNANGTLADLGNLYKHLTGNLPPLSIPPDIGGGAGLIPCALSTCGNCASRRRGLLGLVDRLFRRIPVRPPPDDVENPEAGQLSDVGLSGALTPREFELLKKDPLVWWRVVKFLSWTNGAHHGIRPGGGVSPDIASSATMRFRDTGAGGGNGATAITGAGPVYGCMNLAIVSPEGVWVAHFWQRFFINFQTRQRASANLFAQSVYELILQARSPMDGYPPALPLIESTDWFRGQPWVRVIMMYPDNHDPYAFDPTFTTMIETRLRERLRSNSNQDIEVLHFQYRRDFGLSIRNDRSIDRTRRRTVDPGRGWLTVLQRGPRLVVACEGITVFERHDLPYNDRTVNQLSGPPASVRTFLAPTAVNGGVVRGLVDWIGGLASAAVSAVRPLL